MINHDYIRAIGQKLDQLKNQDASSNLPVNTRSHQSFDPFQDNGDAAIAWLKKQNKWPINGDNPHL